MMFKHLCSILIVVIALDSVPVLCRTTSEHSKQIVLQRCRRHCVFKMGTTAHDCTGNQFCRHCLDGCKHFSGGSHLSTICHDKAVCGQGCQIACQFWLKQRRSVHAVIDGSLREISSSEAPPLSFLGLDQQKSLDKYIYRVEKMNSITDAVSSTEEAKPSTSEVPYSHPSNTEGQAGEVASEITYSRRPSQSNLATSSQTKSNWHLSLASLKVANCLVTASVNWRPPVEGSTCMITWELVSGGLRGHMVLQDSSSAALTLWPEEVYSVQVFCGDISSEKLIVDTHIPAASPNRVQIHMAVYLLICIAVILFIIVLAVAIALRAMRKCSQTRDLESHVLTDEDKTVSQSERSVPYHVTNILLWCESLAKTTTTVTNDTR